MATSESSLPDNESERRFEERFRAFVTATSDVIYQMSADWRVMQQLVGKSFLVNTNTTNSSWLEQYIPPADQARVQAVIDNAIAEKTPFELEHQVIQADGALGWTFSRAIPLLNEQGQIVEWFGTASDITHRKMAQQARRQAEEQYRILFESIDEGFCTVEVLTDQQGTAFDYRFLETNPAFIRQTGFDKAVGRTILELAPQHEPFWIKTYGQIAQTGQAMRFEHQAKALGRYYDVYAFRIGRPQEKRVAILFNDVLARKQAEEALRQSEIRLAGIKHLTLLAQTEELARIGSWDFHRPSGFFTWSASMYQLMGIQPGQPLQPELYLSIATEEDQPIAQQLVDFFRRGEGHFQGRFRIRVGNQTKTLRIKAEVIGEGEETRVVGVDMDITDQLLAQWQLHETAENLQAVLNASPASIGLLKAVRDEMGQVVDFQLAVGNDKLAQFFEQPLSELLGQPAHHFSTLLWDSQTVATLQQVFATKQGIYEEKLLTPAHDRWVALSATQQDDGVVLTGLDITPLKQSQTQQQHWLTELEDSRYSVEALARLKTSLQYRSESLRAVSHDLKSNFGIINGSLALLELADSEAERMQYVEITLRNVKQATGLLSELLDLTRLESSEQGLRLGHQNVSTLFGELGQSMKPLADQQGLALRLTGPDELAIETDELLLHRLVQNLLMNALKYTHKGQVQLRWGRHELVQQWWLAVEDTGPGLAVELVARLNIPTEPVGSADLTNERSIGSREQAASESWASLRGEGIGLRIVREICSLLHGQLQVSSESGKGTRFMVHLPQQYPH